MATVVLWPLEGRAAVGVILPMSTGVRWTNQAGGFLCSHPECEGLWIPLGFPEPLAEALAAAFTDSHGEPPGEDEIAALERVLPLWIRVDRSRLAESQEAWLWVILEQPPAQTVDVTGEEVAWPRQGILTWENSD